MSMYVSKGSNNFKCNSFTKLSVPQFQLCDGRPVCLFVLKNEKKNKPLCTIKEQRCVHVLGVFE